MNQAIHVSSLLKSSDDQLIREAAVAGHEDFADLSNAGNRVSSRHSVRIADRRGGDRYDPAASRNPYCSE